MVELAVIASGDPSDIRTWSGTPFYMVDALRRDYPDLLAVRAPRPRWMAPARTLLSKLTAGQHDLAWNLSLARRHAARVARDRRVARAQVALCIANAPLSAYLPDHLPTIHVSDATAALMQDYYAEFSRLDARLADNARFLDRTSVTRAAACIFPTEWAARSAIEDYGADPSRVHVIPYGANADPGPDADRPRSPGACCHLVFLGMDWVRKGGAIAVDALQALRGRGVAAQLDIIGAAPDLPPGMPGIVVHGRVNKGTVAGHALFNSLMQRADFMLVPTRQECFGIFAAEAGAFGIPVIATRTGGLPNVVQEGVNGHLLPLDAPAEHYAATIAAIWADAARYTALRQSARARFTQALNWPCWLDGTARVIDQVARATSRPDAADMAPKSAPQFASLSMISPSSARMR